MGGRLNVDSCHGRDFLGMKDDATRERWRRMVLTILVLDCWGRAAVPLNERQVLDRLHFRFPRGVPHGDFDIEIVSAAREELVPADPLHPVRDDRWCACGDGAHDGRRNPKLDSPIVSEVKKIICRSRIRNS